MEIILYKTSDSPNKINKTLVESKIIKGTLKDETNILNPTITIQTDIKDYNYIYIPDFNRYYFIRKIIILRCNLYSIQCDVDVLMSYKDIILNMDVLIEMKSGNVKNYVSSNLLSDVRVNQEVLYFNDVFNNGQYILETVKSNIGE